MSYQSGKDLWPAGAREAAGLGWICVDSSAREGMLATILRRLQKSATNLLGHTKDSDVVGIRVGPVGITREMRETPKQDALERSMFVPTLRELRPREVEYLYAMARDQGPSSTSEVARRMGVSMTNASSLRRRLIEHGVIREVRMGLVEFEMPLLDEYLRQSIG